MTTTPPVAQRITIGLTTAGTEALTTIQAHDDVNPSDAVGRALRVYAHLLKTPDAGPLEVPAAGATTPLTDQQLADAVLLLKNQLAAAFEHMDAYQWGYDHGFCGEYGVDPETDSFVDAAFAVVQPELDRLLAELGRVRAELTTAQAQVTAVLALLPASREDDTNASWLPPRWVRDALDTPAAAVPSA